MGEVAFIVYVIGFGLTLAVTNLRWEDDPIGNVIAATLWPLASCLLVYVVLTGQEGEGGNGK